MGFDGAQWCTVMPETAGRDGERHLAESVGSAMPGPKAIQDGGHEGPFTQEPLAF
jgi:hypothetical protein